MHKLLILLLVMVCCGCAERHGVPIPHPKAPPVQDTHTYNVLDLLLIPALLAIAAGVAIMVWLPVKKMGLAIVAGGASLAGSVLFYHALLPYMPWVVLGVLVCCAAYILYRFWLSHEALTCLATGAPVDEATKVGKLVENIKANATLKIAKAPKS